MNVDQTRYHVEDGGNEIKQAIEIRRSSRRKMWIIGIIILVLLGILALVMWIQRCQFFRVDCPAA